MLKNFCSPLSSVQCAFVVLYSQMWPVWLYLIFLQYLIKVTVLEKNILNIKCVLIFSTSFVWKVCHPSGRIKRDIVINVHMFSYKELIILVRFEWNLNFLDRFFENTTIQNFIKIGPVRAELFVANWRTDMKELIVAIPNFSNAPKKWRPNSGINVLARFLAKLCHRRRKMSRTREMYRQYLCL
jgi:hypothetical protein